MHEIDLPSVVAAPVAEVARRILASRFPDPRTSPPATSAFRLADFQAEAVRAAARVLDRWGGVLVADSVGLGKTYIGLALVEETLRSGSAAVVVVPAALRRTWRPGLDRLRRDTGRVVPLVSHTRLALGTGPDVQPFPDRGTEAPPSPRMASGSGRESETDSASDCVFRTGTLPPLVVVDEAHAFRNRHTKRYRALARICRDARVVLLTATPVNNSVLDLYALIRLFARDDTFRDLGVPALRAAFRAAARGHADGFGTADPILPVLRAVVIRRTRAVIRRRYGAVRLPGTGGGGTVLSFPRRASPHPQRYSLFGNGEAFDIVADHLMATRFAPLGPAQRPAPGGAGGLSTHVGAPELVRLALLKRLESSRHAFRLSVERQLRFHEAFADALTRGFLLPARVHRALAGDGDAVQLLMEPVALEPLPAALDRARLAAGVADDIAHLRTLQRETIAAENDSKLEALLALINRLAGRKLVVFTEFRDTASYLWHGLLEAGIRTGRVDGAGAFLGRERAGRRVVIDRFAPRANDAREPPSHERVDVLVATDVLAEGLNLQDAGHVVSYDLPWNPVRLIQRVGRIDRPGSLHDVVHPHFLVPGPELERLLGLHARIRTKLAAIGATVGLDTTVLDSDGAGTSVVERLARGDPAVLDDLERAEAGPVPGLMRRGGRAEGMAWSEMTGPGAYRGPGAHRATERDRAAGGSLPHRGRDGAADQVPCARVASRESLVALDLDGTVMWWVIGGGGVRADDDAAEEILGVGLKAPDRGEDDPGFDPGFKPGAASPGAASPDVARPVFLAALEEARRRRDLARLSPVQDPHSPAGRAARWLRRLLARAGAHPLESALADRVDNMLRRLARPLDAATEARIHEVIRATAHPRGLAGGPSYTNQLSRAVDLLEAATNEAPDDAIGAGRRVARIRWIGALIGSGTCHRLPEDDPGLVRPPR
ncbi:MAG: helicase-related protein [Gemmatimonadota bacterium]